VKPILLGLVLATFACRAKAPSPAAPAPPTVVAARGPTLAIYMPGGNIEDSVTVRGSWAPDEEKFLPAGQASRWGAGSDDLRELAEGLKSRAVGDRVSVWVAFGGARKAGWKGIRYVDGGCLVVDAADEIFGNAPCAAFTDDKADLSQPETLTRFLEFVKGRLGGGPNVLVLWGQGGAHEGVLYDTNHQEMPFMRLPQLRQALGRAGAHFDVLGMDAALMASLEALDVVRPFAKWVVASPGRVPGHGWDYRALLDKLADKDADAQALARAAADGFMDGESLTLDLAGARQTVSHKKSRAKAVSVIDTSKIELVSRRLDELVGADKRAWPRLTTAFYWAPPAARERKSETVESVDLSGAARVTKALVTNLAGRAEALARAVAQAVPYSRHDPQVAWDTKLTVFAPATDRLWRLDYEPAGLLSLGWRAFLSSELGRAGTDHKAPVVKYKRGRYDVSDDRRLAQVFLVRAQPTGPGRWRAVQSSEPTMLTALEEGRSQTGKVAPWDGKVLSLCNGDCTSAITVPTHPEATLANGHLLLSAPALVRDPAKKTDGEDVTLFVELAKDEVVDAWIAPLERDTESRVMFSREQYVLEPGMSIAFLALERDGPKQEPDFKPGPFLDLTQPPHWRRAPLGKPVTTMLVAVDPSHNATYLPIKP
jgi:hypothetical protein